jgi:AAA domain-containing protein
MRIDRACRSRARFHAAIPACVDLGDGDAMKKGIPIEEAKRKRDEREAAARQQRELLMPIDGKKPARSRFKWTAIADIDFKPEDDAGWLVEGMLPDQGVAVLYGRWKSFKSFVALDLAWHIALGGTWAGHKIKRRGAVLYVACEGQSGMRKRIMAYKHAHGDDELPPFWLIEGRPDFGRPPLSGDVVDLVTGKAMSLHDLDVALVIIDTLARTLNGRDENGEGMRNFLDNTEELAERLNCLVLAVHHEGAADIDRPRGATVLPAGVVATWHVKRQRNGTGLGCSLIVEEAKDSVSDFALDVELERIEFGDEHDERRESTLKVRSITPAEIEKPTQKRTKITPTLAAFMTSVGIALDRHGIIVQLPDNGPKVKAVNVELVRPVYYDKRSDLEGDSKRKTFARQMEDAIVREILFSKMINGLPMLYLPTSQTGTTGHAGT